MQRRVPERPDERRREPRVGLALGGGAARGWAHLGVLRALEELGVAVTAVAGTSWGAFVGAAYAAGGLDAVERLYRDRSWRRWFTLLTMSAPGRAMMNEEKLIAIVRRSVPCDDIESFPTRFGAVATDLLTGQPVVFDRGEASRAVRASMSVPGLFPPLVDGDRVLVDGGLVAPVPVAAARDMGVERVIAVDVSHHIARERPYLTGEIPRIHEVVLTSVAVAEVALSDVLLERDPPDVLIRPEVGHIRFLDFGRADEVVEAGRAATLAALRPPSSPLARTG